MAYENTSKKDGKVSWRGPVGMAMGNLAEGRKLPENIERLRLVIKFAVSVFRKKKFFSNEFKLDFFSIIFPFFQCL